MTDLRPGQSDNSLRRQLLDFEDSLEIVIDIIETGEVYIPSVTLAEISEVVGAYEDSTASYTLPISINSSRSTYNFEILGDQMHQIVLSYDLVDELTVDNVATRTVENLVLVSHTFNSFSDQCDTLLCTDGSTDLTLLF